MKPLPQHPIFRYVKQPKAPKNAAASSGSQPVKKNPKVKARVNGKAKKIKGRKVLKKPAPPRRVRHKQADAGNARAGNKRKRAAC